VRRLCKALLRRLPGRSIVLTDWGGPQTDGEAPFPLGENGVRVATLPEALAAVRNRVADQTGPGPDGPDARPDRLAGAPVER
jgi:hypothetical protein